MIFPKSNQKAQDWLTQQWNILLGKKIQPNDLHWLISPFGKTNIIADDFITELAEKEGLIIDKKNENVGLLNSIKDLKLTEKESTFLSQSIIDFYEKTSNYNLLILVKWNPFFQVFGKLLNIFFSNRIRQLNIPENNSSNYEELNSKIFNLITPLTNEVKYTIWYRTSKVTGQVLYSGIYSTCTIPSGITCVKAVFPLPNGNATVILEPKVKQNGDLSLVATGKKFGDPGFYFLLEDSKGQIWAQYISSFSDHLNITNQGNNIHAIQKLKLWNLNVVQFEYEINKK